MLTIEKIDEKRFEEALQLIGSYQEFYGFELNQERNRTHFGQYLENNTKVLLFRP